MSVELRCYPGLYRLKRGLRVVVRNPTNATQDITIKFQDDTGVFAQLVASGVKPGQALSAVLSDDDLGLSARTGKTIVVYPSIPTPSEGIVLLGTNKTPSAEGNAVAIKLSSSVRVTVVDEEGRAVPFANVVLFDLETGEMYVYTSDASGVCEIPERVTSDYGRWVLEVVKPEPDTQTVVYGFVEDFKFENVTVNCKRARNLRVELVLNNPLTDANCVNAIKNCYTALSPACRAFVDWLVSRYGWSSDVVFNAVLYLWANEQINKNGGNLCFIKQEGDTLKLVATVGYGSPILWGAIIHALIRTIPWIAGTIASYFIAKAVESWSPSKTAEQQKELVNQQNQMIDKLNQAYQQGVLNKEQYNEAVSNITGAQKNFADNIPKYPTFDLTGIMSLVVIVLAMILVISLIKAFKSK